MPNAIIDVGTNTFTLLVGKLLKSKKIKVLHDEAMVTRLGQGLSEHHFFQAEALSRSIKALDYFKKICEQHQVDNIEAIGTAACRKAANVDVLKLKLKQQFNINLTVITGVEEAELTFHSVWQDFKEVYPKLMVLDIGGGSTELIVGPQKKQSSKPEAVISLPFGSVRLTEEQVSSDPISKKEFTNLVKTIRARVKHDLDDFFDSGFVDQNYQLIATSGTAVTVYTLCNQLEHFDPDKIHAGEVSKLQIEKLINQLAAKSNAERKKMLGLDKLRADVILAGSIILYEMMNYFNHQKVIISTKGLRYGAFYQKFL